MTTAKSLKPFSPLHTPATVFYYNLLKISWESLRNTGGLPQCQASPVLSMATTQFFALDGLAASASIPSGLPWVSKELLLFFEIYNNL